MIRANRTVDSLVIRTALPAEAGAVAALHLRARATYYPDGLPDDGYDWPAAWSEAIDRPAGQVLCAVRDARLVAIASFRTPEGRTPEGRTPEGRTPGRTPAETVKLFQFHVDPDHWRSGVGTALHTACVEQWRADGRRSAVLDVHADNERAQAFYARQGWVPDPENPPAEGDHHLFLRYAVTATGE